LNQTALIVALPVFLLLGVQARRYSRSRHWKYNAITAWSATCAAYLLAEIMWSILRLSGLTAWSERFPVGEVWPIVLTASLVAYGLARLADRSAHNAHVVM
jgi:hypothetical protein